MARPIVTIDSNNQDVFEKQCDKLASDGYRLVSADCAAHGNDEITETFWLAVFALPEALADYVEPVCVCKPGYGGIVMPMQRCPVHGVGTG